MSLQTEIKRKAFHNLSAVYMALYALLPRSVCLSVLGAFLVVVSLVEFLRLRRPEINAWLIERFRGIHRDHEVLAVSGIFWALLGSWLTMVVFTNLRIVVPAIGFLSFGDAAAAVAGKRWGKHPWTMNPEKTLEGSAAFALVSALWACLFLKPHVALLAAATCAWLEARKHRWNDNFTIPLSSGLVLSLYNLILGRL